MLWSVTPYVMQNFISPIWNLWAPAKYLCAILAWALGNTAPMKSGLHECTRARYIRPLYLYGEEGRWDVRYRAFRVRTSVRS